MEIKKVGVMGCGAMGLGVAQVCAQAGIPTIAVKATPGSTDKIRSGLEKSLGKMVERGKMTTEKMESTLGLLQLTTKEEDVADCDLIVESIIEDLDTKKALFQRLESIVSPQTLLTTNTSTLSVTAMMAVCKQRDRVAGLHFFNPVPVMPLVEVIRGEQSSEAAIATTVQFAQRLGKTPIVVNDCPGFLVNRILFPYFGAFSRLLKDGADYLQIDAAMEEFGWPMGPAYLLDVVGIDTAVHAQAVMAEGFPQRMRYGFTSAMDMLAEAGEYGQKTGSGFYRYAPGKDGRLQKQPDAAIAARIRALHPQQRSFGDAQIVERMMLAMCLETVRCLEDGIVDSAIEADMGLILGLGFPRFRGGALRYIDHIGARAFCDMAKAHADLGPLYTPPALLLDMAAKDQRFYA